MRQAFGHMRVAFNWYLRSRSTLTAKAIARTNNGAELPELQIT